MEGSRISNGSDTPLEVVQIANDMKEVEEFLRTNRQVLVTNIWPVLHAFFSWLRCKSVFTLCDQHLIESSLDIPINKAGKLLDIVATKGRDGFVAFAEVLEYQCPHIFKHIFDITPRIPPAEFRGSVRKSLAEKRSASSVLLEKLDMRLEMFSHMTEDFFENARQMQAVDDNAFQELNDSIQRLQEENAKLQFSMQNIETERDRQTSLAESAKQRVDELSEQLARLQGENAQLHADLRKSKEKDKQPDEHLKSPTDNPGCPMCSSYQRILTKSSALLDIARKERDRMDELCKTESRDKQYYMDRCQQLETARENCVYLQRKDITPLQQKILPLGLKKLPTSPSDFSEDSLTRVTINITTFSDDIKIIGGNYSGIFVQSCSGKAKKAGLNEGDQLVKIEQASANEYARMWSLAKHTKEHVLSVTGKLNGEIVIYKRHNQNRYKLLCEAMKSEVVKDDCFCVAMRESVTPDIKGGLKLARGDIVLITDTSSQCIGGDISKGFWYGIRLDSRTGELLDSGTMTSSSRSARPVMPDENRNSASAATLQREGAFKKKHVYNISFEEKHFNVLPYEAHYKRPVVLFGMKTMLPALYKSLTASTSFILSDLDGITMERHLESVSEAVALRCFTSSSNTVLLKASLKQTTDLMAEDLYPIIIVLKFENSENVPEVQEVENKLFPHQYDELLIQPGESTHDICRRLTELISQDHVIWLNCAAPDSPL